VKFVLKLGETFSPARVHFPRSLLREMYIEIVHLPSSSDRSYIFNSFRRMRSSAHYDIVFRSYRRSSFYSRRISTNPRENKYDGIRMAEKAPYFYTARSRWICIYLIKRSTSRDLVKAISTVRRNKLSVY